MVRHRFTLDSKCDISHRICRVSLVVKVLQLKNDFPGYHSCQSSIIFLFLTWVLYFSLFFSQAQVKVSLFYYRYNGSFVQWCQVIAAFLNWLHFYSYFSILFLAVCSKMCSSNILTFYISSLVSRQGHSSILKPQFSESTETLQLCFQKMETNKKRNMCLKTWSIKAVQTIHNLQNGHESIGIFCYVFSNKGWIWNIKCEKKVEYIWKLHVSKCFLRLKCRVTSP